MCIQYSVLGIEAILFQGYKRETEQVYKIKGPSVIEFQRDSSGYEEKKDD